MMADLSNSSTDASGIITADEVEFAMKVLVVGNGCVGKSSMMRRLCKGQFNDNYKKTIGVDYSETEIPVKGHGMIRLMVWDTAGQEEFDPVTRSYYENAHAVVLAFSTTDRESFETIKSWRDKVRSVCDDLCMVLVQNKIDLADEAVITSEEAEALARELKLKFYRVSVKEYFNVVEAELYFKRLADKSLKMAKDQEVKIKPAAGPMAINNNFTSAGPNQTASPTTNEDIERAKAMGIKPMGPQRVVKKGEGCIVS
ncbi:Ras- protein Rab-23 [Blyttiomyces sp. JEL0837]|nr:Ras- protein Rab-23 [Blyttiomyces sp. JEL0837]